MKGRKQSVLPRMAPPWLALFALLTTHQPAIAGASCSVPGTHSSLSAAVSDTSCSSIALAAGDFNAGITVDRTVSISGLGPSTRLVSQAGQINVLVNAGTLNMSNLDVVVPKPSDVAIYTESGTGAALTLNAVHVLNTEPQSADRIFLNGFES